MIKIMLKGGEKCNKYNNFRNSARANNKMSGKDKGEES